MCEYINETQDSPVLLYIDKDCTQPKKLVFILSLLINDNQEAYSLCGIPLRSSGQPCRMCCVPKLKLNNSMSLYEFNFRKTKDIQTKTKNIQQDFINYLKSQKNQRNKDYQDKFKILQKHSIQPGENPLHESFNWLMNKKIGCLYSISTVDILHTLYKGNVQYAITWTTSVIFLFLRKYPDKMRAKVVELDNRVIRLSICQVLNPFKKHKR